MVIEDRERKDRCAWNSYTYGIPIIETEHSSNRRNKGGPHRTHGTSKENKTKVMTTRDIGDATADGKIVEVRISGSVDHKIWISRQSTIIATYFVTGIMNLTF